MTRKRDQAPNLKQAATIQRLRLEVRHVKEKLRQHQIREIEDLQIALNLPQKNEHSKLTREMTSSRNYEALESLRKALFMTLIQRNHVPQESNDQAPLQPDYIQ